MKKCKFKSDYHDGLDCNLEALSGKDCCIIHCDFPKDEELLSNKIEEKLKDDDFDFEGANLYEFNYPDRKTDKPIIFRNAIVKGDVILSSSDPDSLTDAEFGYLNFRGAEIGGKVKFNVTKIKGNVDFGNDTHVYGDVEFASSVIDGNVIFEDIEIDGDVSFRYTCINRNVDFSNSKITKNLFFTNSEINSNAIFKGIIIGGDLFFNYDINESKILKNIRKGKKLKIKGEANFEKIIVEGMVNFNGIDIGKEFILSFSDIAGSLNFVEAKIGTIISESVHHKYADFSGTEIFGESDFTSAEFNDNAIFSKTKFRESAYFDNVIFNKSAEFVESRFYESASFIDTNFKDFSNFSRSSFLFTGLFSGLNSNLILNSSFDSSKLRNVSFRSCDLTKTAFKYAIFDNCEFTSSIWPNDFKIPEYKEYENNKFNEAELVTDTYRRLRQSLEQQGKFDLAGKFYIQEMSIKKDIYYDQKNVSMWLFYSFLNYLSEYGENAKRLSFFLIFIYIVIALISIIYNVQDPEPSGIVGILIILTGFGSFLMAIFVYVFARKMSRP